MKTITSFKLPALLAGCLFLSFIFGCAPGVPLEQWSHNHPPASEALGAWVKEHSQAAHLFFEWDGNHPDRSQEFVKWTLNHPNLEVDAFVALHPGWGELNEIMVTHKPAARGFMAWCRNYPEAAKTLMSHSGGLRWAGDHLYKEYWNMETPNK
jgi:hypothetical protein